MPEAAVPLTTTRCQCKTREISNFGQMVAVFFPLLLPVINLNSFNVDFGFEKNVLLLNGRNNIRGKVELSVEEKKQSEKDFYWLNDFSDWQMTNL